MKSTTPASTYIAPKPSTPQPESEGVEEAKSEPITPTKAKKAHKIATSPRIAELKKNFEKNTVQPTTQPREFTKPKEFSPMKARDEDSDDETVNNDKYNPMNEKLKPIFKEAHQILSEPSILQLPDSYNVANNDEDLYKSLNLLIDQIHNKKQGTSDYRTLRTIRRELHFNPNEKISTTPKKTPKKK